MPIYNLTTEKVNKLLARRSSKEQELNDLLKLTAKDLWNADLDRLSVAWDEVLQNDILATEADKSGKKKPTSKFAKANRKRASDAADGEYMERKPKVPKTKANSSPKQSKITNFTKPAGAKEMHTAAFTSVNQAGPSSLTIPKKEEISKATPMISIDDDDEFESLVKGIRQPEQPTTINLLSPQTAVKPKKTFTIPGVRKPSAGTVPKARNVPKSKAPKRKLESDDEDDSFTFMADVPAPVEGAERRPARAAAAKAKAIVLTSDDVYDDLDDDDGFDQDEDDDE